MEELKIKDWEKLKNLVKEQFTSREKKILIQAGHFSLLFDSKGILIPAIMQDIKDQKLKEFVSFSNYMNSFPLKTFKIGMELGNFFNLNENEVKFTFIVNDWQWINKGLYNFNTNRNSYYKKQMLPKSYINIFQKYAFKNSDIIKSDHYVNNNIYYSELKLRKFGKKNIKKCSPESCAIEYLPFLSESTTNFDALISFIPMSCKVPVLYSAIEFIKSQSRKIDLIHIFYDPNINEIDFSFMNRENIDRQIELNIYESYNRMELMSK